MTLEEIDPELFQYELYNANGLHININHYTKSEKEGGAE